MSQAFTWDSLPNYPHDYPDTGYPDGDLDEVTLHEWLDSVPFASTVEKDRVANVIDKEFVECTQSEDLASYETWRVTVFLEPVLELGDGYYKVGFMTSD